MYMRSSSSPCSCYYDINISIYMYVYVFRLVRRSLFGKIFGNNEANLGRRHNNLGLIRLGSRNKTEPLALVCYNDERSLIY